VPRRRVPPAVAAVLAAATPALAAPAPATALRVTDTVTLTRPDGTRVQPARDVRVFCGPWEDGVPVPAIHVRVGTGKAAWTLSAVLADVRRRPVVRLPNDFVFDHPRGALLFAVDGANELSSAEEEARGTIRFGRVRCGARPRIAFTVRGRLGSEFFDGAPLTVRGRFVARGG
jgi:hypothetical protein